MSDEAEYSTNLMTIKHQGARIADLEHQLEEAHQTVHRESREALRRAIERAEAAERHLESLRREVFRANQAQDEAERQLDEARKPSDYWRQLAEATELAKQGLEQDIEMIKGERADLAMANADLERQLEGERAHTAFLRSEMETTRASERAALQDRGPDRQWIRGHVGGRSPTTGNGDEP